MAAVKRRAWSWQHCWWRPILPRRSQKKIWGTPTLRVPPSYAGIGKMKQNEHLWVANLHWEMQPWKSHSCLPLGRGCCSFTLVHPLLEHFWDCTRRESNFLFNPWCRIYPKQIVLMKGTTDLHFDLGGLRLDLFGVWLIKTSRFADSVLAMTMIRSLYCSIPNPLVRLEQANLSEMFA